MLKLYLHLTFCVQVPLNQASSQLLPQTQVHNESPSSPSYLHVSPTLVQRKTHEWDSGVQQLSWQPQTWAVSNRFEWEQRVVCVGGGIIPCCLLSHCPPPLLTRQTIKLLCFFPDSQLIHAGRFQQQSFVVRINFPAQTTQRGAARLFSGFPRDKRKISHAVHSGGYSL